MVPFSTQGLNIEMAGVSQVGNGENAVRFGIFEVNSRAGELRRNGVKVKLQEQPFQVLAMLLERPGEVVTREELQRRLWPADTFVDFDHSLNAAVKRLRDALGDSADNPRFVETLAKRGYRFLAPLNGAPANGQAAATPARRSHRWQIAATAIIAAAGISVGWHIGHRTAKPALPVEERLTANSVDAPVSSAAISPDGKLLVYSDLKGMYVKQLATGETHSLPAPANLPDYGWNWGTNWGLNWFADGSHILFSIAVKDKPSLWSVSIFGGEPRKIADDAECGRVSPDGKKIAFLRGEFGHQEIWVMNADGSEQKRMMAVSGFLFGPAIWSPDGRKLADLRAVSQSGFWKEDIVLEVHDVAGGATETILRDTRLSEGLAWLKDGRILFSLAEGPQSPGDTNIWSIKIEERSGKGGGAAKRITSGPDRKPVFEASADGKKLMYLKTNVQPGIFVAKIDEKTKEVGRPERLTLDDRTNLPYEWTPDSKAVLFISDRDGAFRIYRQSADGATAERTVGGDEEPSLLRLNPEGTEILYLTGTGTRTGTKLPGGQAQDNQGSNENGSVPPTAVTFAHTRVMRAPLAGGPGKTLIEEPGINNLQCARAPAKECVFSEFAESAVVFFEFDPVSGTKKELMRVSDASWPMLNWSLSPDGKMLALAKKMHAEAEAELRLVPLHGGGERVLKLKDWAGISTIDWAADGKSLWASTSLNGQTSSLVNVDLRGNVRPVLRENGPFVGWAIPSQDGKKLAIWKATGGSNVWMIEGF